MTLEAQYQKTLSRVRGKVDRAGRVLESEIHRTIAIKTGRLNQSIKTDSPKVSKNIVSVEVGSFGVPYAGYVDQSESVKNYHRRGNVVYTGAGQEYTGRALAEKKAEIFSIITDK